MTITKRQRGRPAGSGKKDEPLLPQVVDSMVRAEANGTKLTATMAMNHALRAQNAVETSHESAVRRLQRKWGTQKEGLLAAARHRQAAQNAPARTIDVSSVRRATESLIESLNRPLTASQQLSRLVSGHTSTMQSLMNALKPRNPMAELMQQISESQRRMKDLTDPPGLRSISEITSNLDNLTKRFRTPF